MDGLLNVAKDYADYVWNFMGVLTNPGHRLFFGYLLVSLCVAYAIYRRVKSRDKTRESFTEFLFPASVWSNPAAWLDVRYFFFHGLIGHFLLFGLGVFAYSLGIAGGVSFMEDLGVSTMDPLGPTAVVILGALMLVLITLVTDFMAFYLHYLQHKIPLLWQFHKVHHAGEVMHPLSNFREHPIDNLTYKLVINLVTGLVLGVVFARVGVMPSTYDVIGVSIIIVAFNLSAYHLRHSHIWLKWPGVWSKLLASPAHHHVHHSRHPDHLDKNFAFMFPFWDVLFGTYHMPEDNRDVEFGIVEDASELNSCLNLYLIPFRDAYRLLNKDTAKAKTPAKTPKTAGVEAAPL